jgi:hypothetical protein
MAAPQIHASRGETLSPNAQQDAKSVPEPEEIRLHLRKILKSPAFRRSRRCQAFLQYLVEKALLGRLDDLKERTIAVEVFGRRSDLDLGADTIVRVCARELRRRLAEYYMDRDSLTEPVRIDVPVGSYVPEFRAIGAVGPSSEPPGVTRSWVRMVWLRHRRPIQMALALAAGVALWMIVHPVRTELELFWKPVFNARGTVLILVPNLTVYSLPARVPAAGSVRSTDLPPLLQQDMPVLAGELASSGLIPVPNKYVGYGDLLASGSLAAFLGQHQRPPRFRMENTAQFADFEEGPVVVIGAFTNRWALEVSEKLPFHFSRSVDGRSQIEQKGGRAWTLGAVPADGTREEDYILVTRLRDAVAGKPIISLAGLKQVGTQAAGALLTNPVLFDSLSRWLPSGWPTKNLQLLLHIKVVGGGPAAPELVASRVW